MPKCPHGTFGGWIHCMACRPELLDKSINFNDTKQSKNKLLKYLNFHREHYKQLYNHYITENNPNLIRYANEFNGKYKLAKFLIFLIERGEFDLYD